MVSNTDFLEQARALMEQMTPEEKASLTSGKDFWCTKEIRHLSVPSLRMADGPHGIRRQIDADDAIGINDSHPATCFPTASMLSCSFDPDLAARVGHAIGEEALSLDVSVVLGPGANQKRSPLCGRNFEYFSEDPLLTGKMAAAMIRGIQDTGAGACLKHFAVNNQEKYRMTINASIDERTLRESYLSGFEYAVKEGKPWMVMSAYNKINDIYCSENKRLLTDILRRDWGFQGTVVTDWGANNDRIAGINAGQDLEMPGCICHDKEVAAAARLTHLDEDALDASVVRMTALALAAKANREEALSSSPTGFLSFDKEAHHHLAQEAALKSAVLLKNEGNLLPGSAGEKIAVIGGFAKAPRFQGAGSSKIHPIKIDTVCEILEERGIDFSYAQGYPMSKEDDEAFLLREAVEIARGKDKVYIFAGLPEDYESEGFDRSSLILPDSHNVLIRAIGKENPHTAVILCGGSAMELPWFHEIPAVLYGGLWGQAGAGAILRLLLGEESPSGKLSETWPLSLEDTPAARYFPGGNEITEYRESIFIGYRFYEKAKRPVRFPFGFGLSYTSFAYSGLRLSQSRMDWGGPLTAYITVTNTGKRPGTEIIQIYASGKNEKVFLPEKQLAGFSRVFLKPGEKKEVSISLSPNAFAYYNTEIHDWYASPGTYRVLAGPSSAYTPLRAFVTFTHEARPEPDYRLTAPDYFSLEKEGPLQISDESFYGLTGFSPRPLSVQKTRPFDLNITLTGARSVFTGRFLWSLVKFFSKRKSGMDPMSQAMLWEMPLRSFFTFSQGAMSSKRRDGILDMLNGKLFRAIRKLLF